MCCRKKMSILAALALAVALVATPATVESRPLALVSGEYALQQSMQLQAVGSGRQLHMSMPPPPRRHCVSETAAHPRLHNCR